MNSESQKSPNPEDDALIVPSILSVKASAECEASAIADILESTNNNKSIAELLDEEKDNKEQKDQIDQKEQE